ncbi:sigma-70 family RNA polymerase sigma factor [Thalassotalea sp. PS06]|uniref:sigma-70 family RNA polymerase sigma factor n=1 Tax=Thalassotalea sp. PS06 TaxID=2594005 RepID=UPI001162D9AB|nr:sigma-70 family RNA polymerase sigma factor [Thalassotalea sp. PS06]QDP01191.1 sigma-70 family RNA polymerase sigma factor [Thalassotalea sp. PS06]
MTAKAEISIDMVSIWQQFSDQLKGFLHSKVSDANQVEDLLQDILIKSYQQLSSLNDISKIKPWLFQIANHTIIDYYRKQGRDSKVVASGIDDNVLDSLANADTEDFESPLTGLEDCLEPFIEALPKESRDILTAIDLHGQSQKEYAEHHGIPYSTLKSRTQKSRELLRGLFNSNPIKLLLTQ